jgi:hypothetical protein
MKSKLLRIGIVSMMVGLMACASSAFAQAAGEESDKTILVQYALPNGSPGPISAVKAASMGTGANNQMSYGPVARPTNESIAFVLPTRRLAAAASRDCR